MVRRARAEQHEGASAPVIGIGNEYAAGYRHPDHSHRRGQLLFAEYGTMLVDTRDQRWLVPPHEGVWIPRGVVHGMRMLSAVGTRSVYFTDEAARDFAPSCRVIGISALLRQLLIEAADLPTQYQPGSRSEKIMALIVDEVRAAPVRPLSLPLPRDPALAERFREFARMPSIQRSTHDWCEALAMGRRTFTRLVRRETGLSYGQWQRRACLHAALPRLLKGESVTRIALDLGYSSPAAFTAMFKALTCKSPVDYLKQLK